MTHDDSPDTQPGDKGPMKIFLECIARQLADRWITRKSDEESIEELGEPINVLKPDTSTNGKTSN